MYSKSLAILFMSLSVVALGFVAFFTAFSLESQVVYGNLAKILPQSVVLGTLGFFIGKILDYAYVKK